MFGGGQGGVLRGGAGFEEGRGFIRMLVEILPLPVQHGFEARQILRTGRADGDAAEGFGEAGSRVAGSGEQFRGQHPGGFHPGGVV